MTLTLLEANIIEMKEFVIILSSNSFQRKDCYTKKANNQTDMLPKSCGHKKYKRHRRHGSMWRIYKASRQIFQAIFANNIYYLLIEMK